MDERKADSRELMIAHLNINSLQNKFDDLQILNDSLKAHILLSRKPKSTAPIQTRNFFYGGLQNVPER